MADRKILNPSNVAQPTPTYSHVLKCPISPTASLITVAGQIGVDSTTNTVPPTMGEQVECALTNLDNCLKAAGATAKDIIKVTHYIVNYDPSDRSRIEPYFKLMGDHRPPSTLVGVATLAQKELLYEIEAMAIVTNA